MSKGFGGVGRPSKVQLEQQRREFLRLVAEGVDFDEAATRSQIKPIRALAILSHPEVRPLLRAA